MAHTVVTRADSFFTKKLLSQLVINVDEVSKGQPGGVVDAGNYLVARLPEDCIIQNAYVFTTVPAAGAVDIDVGTTEAGIDILDSGNAQTPGESGTAGAKQHTGSGKDVYMAVGAAFDAAQFYVVIEYVELRVDTGSMTQV